MYTCIICVGAATHGVAEGESMRMYACILTYVRGGSGGHGGGESLPPRGLEVVPPAPQRVLGQPDHLNVSLSLYIYMYIHMLIYIRSHFGSSLIGPKVGRLRPNAIAHCGANVCAHGLCG